MELLEFARGPALQVALVVFVFGICYRMPHLVSDGAIEVDVSKASWSITEVFFRIVC